MNQEMQVEEIHSAGQAARCVTAGEDADLEPALRALGIKTGCPVITLIGGSIPEQHGSVTQGAIQTIAEAAEAAGAAVLSGGTRMGVMEVLGQARLEKRYGFPLLGIAPASLVTWPGGPKSRRFLGWGTQRVPLADGYSHFLLTPGKAFGDESPWIVQAGGRIAQDQPAITVLANGGSVARLDIRLALEAGRNIIVLAGTGRLADKMAKDAGHAERVSIVPAGSVMILIQNLKILMKV